MIIINIFNKMLRKLGIQAGAAANRLDVLEALVEFSAYLN
jgi:hypothetical protein